ncbi:formyl transferase [Rhizobium sp. 0TCS1.26]|uniref:glucosamine inositolphosphorylceramide transferase family protein n=1 Tax=Rhizobium sp. 0TCS1.26 TaxID=3142623 RepID=UPI003D2A6917
MKRLQALPDMAVSVELVPASALPQQAELPAGLESLFLLEATIFGRPRDRDASRVPVDLLTSLVSLTDAPVDVVLDLCGGAPADGRPVWSLSYDGIIGQAGLIDAILDGRTPTAELSDNGRIIASGRLGTEYGGVALASFEDMLARSTTMIVAALQGSCQASLPTPPGKVDQVTAAGGKPRNLAAIAAKKLARRIVQQIYRLCYNSPHWRVGWRQTDGRDLFDLKAHPQTGWHDLPDDGRRFYADPVPLLHQGQVTLFVEDFEHSLGKGIISAVPFGASGPIGTPVPVLEMDCHLSYPFVFEEEGEIWMIPETSGNGTIELLRSTAFPGGWVREAVLVSGVVASDATIIRRGATRWMFATVRDGGGAFSDALHLWSAPDFRGPWTPHRQNPVMIDIASARPAGRMVERGGSLYRPVQDCRRGYGAALALAQVTRLDDGGFEQTVETLLEPGPVWPGRRLHSLNSAGNLEFIDGSAFSPRWKAFRNHRTSTR